MMKPSVQWGISFADQEHQDNYEQLMAKYKLTRGEDVQYEANIYVAAYPEIFKCINMRTLKTSSGPLYNIMKWDGKDEDDDNGKWVLSAGGLTGSTTRLAEVGLSLYNGYEIGLDDVLGSLASKELFEVFMQAIKIRARK